MATPKVPSATRRDELLAELADLVARGGAESLLAPPVTPGLAAFPEPWRPTRGGAIGLLRRLAWHAGNPRAVRVIEEAQGAPPTERKPATRAGLTVVTAKEIVFRIEFLGADDVAGTLAHEIGVAHAVANRRGISDPYRAGDGPERLVEEGDLERGSIATVYLGLGVVAINAAFQQYSRGGRFNGGYEPLEYDVLRAGYVPMSELAFLLAVQAAVRGAAVPGGLSPPQRDEVTSWLGELRDRAGELKERLGIADDAEVPVARPLVVAFDDVDLDDVAEVARPDAFRWRTHRGGLGFFAGAVVGAGAGMMVAMPSAMLGIVVGTATVGHLIGRRVLVPRCSACATVVRAGAPTCGHCGAALRGDIDHLNDRLEAEERLRED
ncbi:MAG TPA: zinc ribbon domain-containing protein [Kofleriaceae bacterium]|nr:zinc ribbon domain-containing protein [Kofleriaceae bacterium]